MVINAMQKRGQATVFAILGIVILIIVALFFLLRNEFGFFVSPTSFLGDKAKPIEDNLKDCVSNALKDSLDIFGKQSGYFAPANYLLYQDMHVKYYCLNIPNKESCLNVMPTLSELIDNLNNRIEGNVNNCVDKDLIKSGLGYEIKAGRVSTNILTSDTGITVKAHYDVKITKGENSYTVRDAAINYDAPIKSIYSVAVDAVNSESRVGFFEQLLYMLDKKGQFVINLDKPYPDKVYKIQKKDSSFEFWFAIEGERNI